MSDTAGMIQIEKWDALNPDVFNESMSLIEGASGTPEIWLRICANVFDYSRRDDSWVFVDSTGMPEGWQALAIRINGEWFNAFEVTTLTIADRSSGEYEAWRDDVVSALIAGLPCEAQWDNAEDCFVPFKRGRRNRAGLEYDREKFKAGLFRGDWLKFKAQMIARHSLPVPPTLAELGEQQICLATGGEYSCEVRVTADSGAWSQWATAYTDFVVKLSGKSAEVSDLDTRLRLFGRGTQTERRDAYVR